MTENVFADAAKRRKIPVILVNHGHIGRGWSPLGLGRVDRYCDAVLAWNDEQKDTWLRLYPDLDPSRVYSVGGIQWDEPMKRFSGYDRTGAEMRRIRSLLGSGESPSRETDEKWITITIDDHVRRFLGEVLKTLCQIDGIRVVIKTRPHESADEYRNLVNRGPIAIVSRDSKIELFDLLYASDLVMTCASTTNLDALSVGTPVMTLTMDRRSRLLDRYVYLERFGLPGSSSGKELRGVIGNWVASQKQQMEWRESAACAARALLSNYPLGNAGEKMVHLVGSFRRDDISRTVSEN